MKKIESGRSMVEMLGVLAIIGVLSVGGIAGYTMAMNKYKANNIISEASQCAILARTYNQGNGVGTPNPAVTCQSLGIASTSAVASYTVTTTDAGATVTTATAIDEGICKAINGAMAGGCNTSTKIPSLTFAMS